MDIPKYYIAGDRGLVGTWYKKKYPEALGGNTQNANYMSKISTKTDLQLHKPTHVIINAATVGGLQEDLDKSFELMIKNLTIQNNIFEACRFNRTDRVLLQGLSRRTANEKHLFNFAKQLQILRTPNRTF